MKERLKAILAAALLLAVMGATAAAQEGRREAQELIALGNER